MKLKLKYKIFIILLSASTIIIACMFLFTYHSFEKGLLTYVDKMEMNRLELINSILEEEYDRNGSWKFLKDNPEKWVELLRYTHRKRRHRTSDPHEQSFLFNDEFQYNDKPGDKYGTGRKKRPEYGRFRKFSGRHGGIVLLDKDKKQLFGMINYPKKIRLKPITVQNKTVGWIGHVPSKFIVEKDELIFFKQQSRTFLMIAVLMVLISIIVALCTVYYLERPIRVLTKGTKDLASGKYDIRIPVTSEDEMGQLSRDFNTLAMILEKNEKERKQWVEDIAHELRTPLTLLSGEFEAIQDGVRNMTPETLTLLEEEIAHLIQLVDDLNELSKTNLGALSYKKKDIDPVKIFNRTIEKFQENFTKKDLVLEYNPDINHPILIFADSRWISQMFGNIFQNTLDYTSFGGSVKIWNEKIGRTVVFNIQDSEPGVKEESLARLFDRLYRVESSRSREFGGIGLGLSICKNIVEAHEGTIKASPSPLGGLWIQIELPIKI